MLGKTILRPTTGGSTSEEEFWKDDPSDEIDFRDEEKNNSEAAASSNADETPRAIHRTTRLERTFSEHSPRKRMLADKAAGSSNAYRHQGLPERAQTMPTPQHGGEVPWTTTNSRKTRYHMDGHDTDEDEEVEHMVHVDTYIEGSAPPSREPSFEFSNPSFSRGTSCTSTTSSVPAPTTPTTRRKRTYEYPELFNGPPSPISPTKVQKRTSQTERSSRPSFPRPRAQTAARTRTPSPTKLSSSRSTADESPSRRDRLFKQIQEALASESAKEKAETVASSSATRDHEGPKFTTALSSSPTSREPFYSVTGPTPAVSGPSSAANPPVVQSKDAVTVSPTSSFSIIAHSRRVQRMMDEMCIAWGVQYELARGVCSGRWQWRQVTAEKLESLRGLSKDKACCVEQVILETTSFRSAQLTNQPLWAELDREDKAIEEGTGRGFGLRGEWEGEPSWYGGKIRQIANVVETETKDRFELRLKAMVKRKSNRFARYLGSRRMIQVKLPDDKIMRKQGEAVRLFMQKKFVLCGRVFVPFAAKDGKVFLMETNEDYERVGNGCTDRGRISLIDFVRWHNPMELNSKQPVTKWVTRYDLGLSDTIPALAFKGIGVDIFYIEDEVAPHDEEKTPTEKILTDGCGYMNWAALAAIARALKYTRFPTAAQGRIAGAKGLWVLHPYDRSPDASPTIWIRPSQEKIKHAQLDKSHLIFELVAPPRVSAPSRLSRHTIMVLSHNGVRDTDIVSLMAAGVDAEVHALSMFDNPHLLHAAVAEVGRIFAARLQRLASGSGRVLGLGREWGQEEDEEEEGELDHDGQVSLVDRNEHSGDPVKIHERVCEMLAAGFKPRENNILHKSLRDIIGYRIAELVKEYHITVPKSADAFIVPDPYGVLKPNEIHFKASEDLKDPLEGPSPNIITGSVLIYRNPARLPADIQKVTAVTHPCLVDYTDVIVLPVTGDRSLASLLAGGDYDGDTCVCIFDELLVQSFRGSPVTDAPVDFLTRNFKSQANILQVADVLKSIKVESTSRGESCLQEALLVGMISPNYGQYSIYHENAAYVHGLADIRSLHNAWMFNTVLDSKKTGLMVKESILAQDRKLFNHKQPPCLSIGNDEEIRIGFLGEVPRCPDRNPKLPPFVLDQLLKAGKKLEEEHLTQFEKGSIRVQYNQRDDDLLRPWESAIKQAARLKETGYTEAERELEDIRKHVDVHVTRWQLLAKMMKPDAKGSSARKESSDSRQQQFKLLSKTFAEGPENLVFHDDRKIVSTLKASCAYSAHPKLAFSVAFYELCRIKAESGLGGIAPCTRELADMMTLPASARRILMQKASGL